METNLLGRLRNTSLPKSHALLPLFEAVANSIHAIEERSADQVSGRIVVQIQRVPQTKQLLPNEQRDRRGREALAEIDGFRIVDNGIGFNDRNMESFNTLDSSYKAALGGRGVGRLLWLKAFQKVTVSSVFFDSNNREVTRKFDFSSPEGVKEIVRSETIAKQPNRGTIVSLVGFKETYKNAARKSCKSIAEELLQHCLWYFIRESSAPEIRIEDGDESISLWDVYDEATVRSIESSQIFVKGVAFDLTHVRLLSSSAVTTKTHSLAFCAANRLVREEPLKNLIEGLGSSLYANGENFYYRCYVTSSFLDENVRTERTSFDIDEESTELFAASELSFREIINAVVENAKEKISEALSAKKVASTNRIQDFVSNKAPRYKPILDHVKDNLLIDPEISDKDLELKLHQRFAEFERSVLAEGRSIMRVGSDEEPTNYEHRLSAYLSNVDDLKKSDLAGYVSHRKVIIDLLRNAIQIQPDGKYSREDRVHTLLMPMGVESTEPESSRSNLWLLDERLAFHDFLASDKRLDTLPITDTVDLQRPDLCALKVVDSPAVAAEGLRPPFNSLTLVEIKRPMRNDGGAGVDKDPIEQCLDYLRRIRSGKVKSAGGRSFGDVSNAPAFCYVIADLTPSMIARCDMHDLTQTGDGLGYFGYKKHFKAYVEVLSYDRMVNAASERNRAFFDQLALPAN